jgi:uracil-DNA glycosylase family protein
MPENLENGPAEAPAAIRRRSREWRKVRSEAEHCEGCDLHVAGTRTVFGTGPLRAEIVMVGDQPADEDERNGEPFSGPPGEVLRKAMIAADIDPSSVYFTNAVKHFRFEAHGKRRLQRTPEPEHVTACHGWLANELDLIDPRLVVLLGSTAVRSVAPAIQLRRDHGRVVDVGGRRVLATLHPSGVLRTEDRQLAMRTLIGDLEAARGFCDSARRRPTVPLRRG